MTRSLLESLVVLVVCAGPSTADPAKFGDPKKEAEKLEKVQDALNKIDSSLTWLSRAAWVGSVLTGSPELKKGKEFVDQLRGPVADLKRGVDGVVDIKDPEKRRQEARKLGDTRACKDLATCRPKLEQVGERVRSLPVGLVSERIDPKFVVSGDLLVRDLQEARRRFAAYVAAMDANIKYLEDMKANLEELRLRARAASQVLGALAQASDKAARAGLFSREMTMQFLEADRSQGVCTGIASDCDAKLREVNWTLETERRRRDNLKAMVKTLFDFDI